MTQATAKVNYSLELNPQFNSIEISFKEHTMINFCWYYHEQDAGAYHAIERRADGPRRTYHALFCIDPETREARSYSGPLPSRYQAETVLHHLAPDAVRLDGLPAFMR